MKFFSTRHSPQAVGLSAAIAQGIAPDGGLYVPERFPQFELQGEVEEGGAKTASLPIIARQLIEPFAAGDPLSKDLAAVTSEAFNFDAPLVAVQGAPGPLSVLELFHGPTSAFKDFGARFLAASLQRIRAGAGRKLTILVATSGDTGGAVAAAFHRRPGFEVAVLYPKGMVSQRQAQQLSCWGGNVRTFAVQGNFDDCQRIVKEAFQDTSLGHTHQLSSANSINVGRLLPQMVYYARSSLDVWRRTGRKANFIIPTGNLGNALACVWARRIGLPIGDIVLATNRNTTVGDYLRTGAWQPKQSISTLASAMDVGNPSNMERLRSLYPEVADLRSQVTAFDVSDDQIRETIVRDARELGQIWCPHTATAAHVYRQLMSRDGEIPDEPGARMSVPKEWILVATAHPAKFNDVVEPLLGRSVPVPPQLAALLELPRQEREIQPTLAALRQGLQEAVGS
jgi:threonine synthase